MSYLAQYRPAINEMNEKYPFQEAGGNDNLFPPVALKSHWDPTQIIRLILPDGGQSSSLPLPMDFRPWVKISKEYRTSGPAVKAPTPPDNIVFGMGGKFYPPERYSKAIDKESVLRYLDRRLDKWCQAKEYISPTNSDMFQQRVLIPNGRKFSEGAVADRTLWQGILPQIEAHGVNINNGLIDRTQIGTQIDGPIGPGGIGRMNPPSEMITDLAMPSAVLREGPYKCRAEADAVYWNRSNRLFNNPTKNDRYADMTIKGSLGRVMPGGNTKYNSIGAIRPRGGGLGAPGAETLYQNEKYYEMPAPA